MNAKEKQRLAIDRLAKSKTIPFYQALEIIRSAFDISLDGMGQMLMVPREIMRQIERGSASPVVMLKIIPRVSKLEEDLDLPHGILLHRLGHGDPASIVKGKDPEDPEDDLESGDDDPDDETTDGPGDAPPPPLDQEPTTPPEKEETETSVTKAQPPETEDGAGQEVPSMPRSKEKKTVRFMSKAAEQRVRILRDAIGRSYKELSEELGLGSGKLTNLLNCPISCSEELEAEIIDKLEKILARQQQEGPATTSPPPGKEPKAGNAPADPAPPVAEAGTTPGGVIDEHKAAAETACDVVESMLDDIDHNLESESAFFRALAKQYEEAADRIDRAREIISPVGGHSQGKIFRKRQNVNRRRAIVANPGQPVDEVGIPEDMAWAVFGGFVMRRLTSQGLSALEAKKAIDYRTGIASDALNIVMKERPVRFTFQ